jgi:hypothetical protein
VEYLVDSPIFHCSVECYSFRVNTGLAKEWSMLTNVLFYLYRDSDFGKKTLSDLPVPQSITSLKLLLVCEKPGFSHWQWSEYEFQVGDSLSTVTYRITNMVGQTSL